MHDLSQETEETVLWVSRQQQLRLWCRVHQSHHLESERNVRNAVCPKDEHLQRGQNLHLGHRGLLCTEEPRLFSGVRSRRIQFAAMSGRLHINFAKSTLVPIHADVQLVEQCVRILGCSKGNFPQQYLGLPLSTHKLPASAFNIYIHKSDKFLASCQADLLNPMGRTVLVNSVLDSLLIYLMSSLQLPASAVHAMDRKRRAFLWWGTSQGSRLRPGAWSLGRRSATPVNLVA